MRTLNAGLVRKSPGMGLTGTDNRNRFDWFALGPKVPSVIYQPVGAKDLASSYVNLINPGVNDAIPLVPPVFNKLTGWNFFGTELIQVGQIVPFNFSWTCFIQFTDLVYTQSTGIFSASSDTINKRWGSYVIVAKSTRAISYNMGGVGGSTAPNSLSKSNMNVCIAGGSIYLNGIKFFAEGTNFSEQTGKLRIGGWEYSYTAGAPMKVRGVAVWEGILNSSEVASVVARMANL